MVTVTAQLLGGLRLECGGQARQLTSARAKAIAAYLLLHRGQPQQRAHLAYLLWPESDERQARTNLRQVLHQLRRGFPEAGDSLSLDGQQLQWRRDGSIEVDVERFEEVVKRAAWAREVGGLAQEQGWLEQAAALYGGDLLPEMYDAWLEPLRESLRAVYGGVLERLLTLAEERLDNPGAV
jgi:DNA-binding SARP family transcriptional activator